MNPIGMGFDPHDWRNLVLVLRGFMPGALILLYWSLRTGILFQLSGTFSGPSHPDSRGPTVSPAKSSRMIPMEFGKGYSSNREWESFSQSSMFIHELCDCSLNTIEQHKLGLEDRLDSSSIIIKPISRHFRDKSLAWFLRPKCHIYVSHAIAR